jgi:hypothetical protein
LGDSSKREKKLKSLTWYELETKWKKQKPLDPSEMGTRRVVEREDPGFKVKRIRSYFVFRCRLSHYTEE